MGKAGRRGGEGCGREVVGCGGMEDVMGGRRRLWGGVRLWGGGGCGRKEENMEGGRGCEKDGGNRGE